MFRFNTLGGIDVYIIQVLIKHPECSDLPEPWSVPKVLLVSTYVPD